MNDVDGAGISGAGLATKSPSDDIRAVALMYTYHEINEHFFAFIRPFLFILYTLCGMFRRASGNFRNCTRRN